jgi:hypothetical protein
MKLIYSLYILLNLSTLLSCTGVEVWIDKKFTLNQFKELCGKLTSPPPPGNQSDPPRDQDQNNLTKTNSGSGGALQTGLENHFIKCDRDLKDKWKSQSPVAPNIIKINGKEFIFAHFWKKEDVIYSNLERPITQKNLLFTRFVYRNAPCLFENSELDKGKRRNFFTANQFMRENKKFDQAAELFVNIKEHLSKNDKNKDLIYYLNENLAYNYMYKHHYLWDKLNREKDETEKGKLGENLKELQDMIDKVFSKDLAFPRDSFFNYYIHFVYSEFQGNVSEYVDYLRKAADKNLGDVNMADELIYRKDYSAAETYIINALTLKNELLGGKYLANIKSTKLALELHMGRKIGQNSGKRRKNHRKLKKL